MSKDTNAVQYAVLDGVHVRCGQTVDRIPAGIYEVVDMGMRGFGLREKPVVADDLIDLPGTVADEIFDDIESFMGLESTFQDLGLTHKRGYLMHGPGGTGKTSIGLMLARRFISRRDGVAVFTPDPQSFFHGTKLMGDVEPGRPSMYLMEEVDRIVDSTACLSILDGESSMQGAVFVAMTNYKSSLPQRITNRPGRFARVVLIDAPPGPIQVEYLTRLARRRPDLMDGRSSPVRIVEAFRGVSMTMDHLREAFVSHVVMGEPLDAIRERFVEMARIGEATGTEDETGATFGWEPSSSDC